MKTVDSEQLLADATTLVKAIGNRAHRASLAGQPFLAKTLDRLIDDRKVADEVVTAAVRVEAFGKLPAEIQQLLRGRLSNRAPAPLPEPLLETVPAAEAAVSQEPRSEEVRWEAVKVPWDALIPRTDTVVPTPRPKTDWASVLGLTLPPENDLDIWGFLYAYPSDPFATQRLCDTRSAASADPFAETVLFRIEDMKDARQPIVLGHADGIAKAVAEFAASESDPVQIAFKATVHGVMTMAAVRKLYSEGFDAYRKALLSELVLRLCRPVLLADVDEGIRMARAVLCD